jgi:hypothetical protein
VALLPVPVPALGSEASLDLSGAGALVAPATLLEPPGLLGPPVLPELPVSGVGAGVDGGCGVGVGEDGGCGVGVGDAIPQLPLPVGGCGVGVGDAIPQLPPPVGGCGVGVGASSMLSPMFGGRQVPGRMQGDMGAICIVGGGVGMGDAMPQLEPPGGGGGSSARAPETVATLTARTTAATRVMRLVTLIVFFILLSLLLLSSACFQVYDRRGQRILQPHPLTPAPPRRMIGGGQ